MCLLICVFDDMTLFFAIPPKEFSKLMYKHIKND
jgi:hypothetical protein